MNSLPKYFFARVCILIALLDLAFGIAAFGQAQAPDPQAPSGGIQPSGSAPLTLTLQDALERAKKINPDYHSAVTDFGVAKEDKVQSRAALLPNVNFGTTYLYTDGNGNRLVRYIANNSVHEYIRQGNVHQDVSLQ